MKLGLADVAELLAQPSLEGLLERSYFSITQRLETGGFFAESLSGSYAGMYPRTLGALARLLEETGEIHLLEAPLRYCLRAMDEAGLELVPHVLGPEQNGHIPVLDELVQVDAVAHVVLAWALLEKSGKSGLSSAWPAIAALLDRIVRPPFLSDCTHWRIEPGLILNCHLEHSREGQYWHAYDFLSQAFVGAALEQMIPLAQLRGDHMRAKRWFERNEQLKRQVEAKLTCTREGKTMYLEMLLPTGREPVAFQGCGWLNLAPVASGWSGVDEQLLENTVNFWHREAAISCEGLKLTACDWSPERPGCETYGKVLGWDLLHALKTARYDNAADILDFLRLKNTTSLFAEILRHDMTTDTWEIHDAGNGEQVSWLCWALAAGRKLAGLTPLPLRNPDYLSN